MTKNNTETLQQNYINFGHLGNIPQNNVKVFVSKTADHSNYAIELGAKGIRELSLNAIEIANKRLNLKG